jgi:formylglycine-generating enzyme required for sulfatase activity
MGIVYEAWDDELQRRVAVKVLAGSSSGAALERFKQEALLAGRLRHPNIVVVHEAGTDDGQSFIAMEFVEGKTLEDEINDRLGGADLAEAARAEARRAALAGLDLAAVRRSCALVRDVARALHFGHTYCPPGESEPVPIIHRDVKPANVIVDRSGVPRLLDYGLAKETGLTLTLTREAVGTPLYMSPEQLFSARRVGPRSDVYSLGMTLYACVTLARPFELSQPEKIFEHLMHDDPPRARLINRALPRDVETIIRKATEKDERRRYASAHDMAEDLAAFLEDRPIRARPPGIARRVLRVARRRAVILSFLGGALLLGAVGAVKSGLDESEAEEARAAAETERVNVAQGEAAKANALLAKAAMVYDLAALSQGEDPESERWLTLLNEGHLAESQGNERARAAQEFGVSPSIRRHALLARIARNDRGSREELHKLLAAAVDARRRLPEREGALTTFESYAARDPAWLARRLAGFLSSTAVYDEAPVHVVSVFGRGEFERERDALDGPEGAAAVSRIVTRLRASTADLRALAEEEPRLADGLRALAGSARISVALLDPSAKAEVSIEQPPAPPVKGRAGEALEAPAGEVVITVRDAKGEVRFPFHTVRPKWGAPSQVARIVLPIAPGEVPRDMVLVRPDDGGPSFLLDRVEVSVARYEEFLAAVGDHARCPAAERARFPGGKDHRPDRDACSTDKNAPVTGIDWWDACAYAAWAGKRLPTREEWRRAALGAMERGGVPNLRGIEDGWLWASPVDMGPTSLAGARNLVGNVAELVAAEDDDFPFREAVGGGWSDAPGEPASLVARYALGARGADLGFRCARSLEARAARSAAALPATLQHEPDDAAMRLVAGGDFALGATGSAGASWRQRLATHRVTLRPFYIDVEPVTWAQYVHSLVARKLEVPPSAQAALDRTPHAPAVGIAWRDASAYAAWAGKRLPTEAEWEVAVGLAHAFKPRKGQEWCADCWHGEFLSFINRDNPVNRWNPEEGHVMRNVGGRSGSTSTSKDTGFRCVLDAPEDAR